MKNIYYLIFLFVWTACSHAHVSEEDKKLLAEAKKIHEEAYTIHDEIMPKMDKIAKYKKNLEDFLEKEEDLEEEEKNTLKAKVEALEKVQNDMKTWMDNAVGLPEEEGHDHHHDHEGHDHHDHAKAPEVTAQDMLDIQKEMKKNIEKLKADMKEATKFVMIKGEKKFESDIFTE